MLDNPRVEAARHPLDRLRPELTLFDATMLVVSSVIGVGIFLTPGVVADALPNPSFFLGAWVVGGILSLAGALANAELGAMYPHAGGDYVYLREAWHPRAGFVIGWLSFFVIYAGTVATLSVGFAEGLASFVPMEAGARTAVAVAITLAVSSINHRGVRLGALINNLTAGFKIAALVALAVAGPLVASLSASPPTPHAVGAATTGVTLAGFGLALSPVLFLHALPIETMRGETRVGEAAARVFFGDTGATLAALLILGSIASCLNATVLVGPRIAYAMAIDGLFFRAVKGVHLRYSTPHVAIWVQAATAIALIVLLGRFPSVLNYT
ncbi:MAG: APC family permease, partial [Candidatus Binatia bacterium]